MSNQILVERFIELLFIISTSLCFTMVVAHATRHTHWIVRMFDFPVKQLVITHLLITIIMCVFIFDGKILLHTVPLAIGSISVLILSYTIWPYTPFHKKDVRQDPSQKGERIKIMTANVFMENTEYDRLLEQVKHVDPDCLLLLETDIKWEKATRGLDQEYPYQIKYPLENTYGLLFFSKLKINTYKIRFLVKDQIPSIKAHLETKSGNEFIYYGLHPEPPSPTESDTSTPRDIELLKVAKEVKSIETPIVCSGDFNDVAWSHTSRLFRRYSGLLDPRIGRGSFSTFHSKYPLLRWPLDHCFLSSHFTLNSLKVLPLIGSDHFPIFISVNLNTDKQQREPSPVGDDVEEVQEVLAKDSELEA